MHKEAVRQQVPGVGRRGGILVDEMQIQDDLQVYNIYIHMIVMIWDYVNVCLI